MFVFPMAGLSRRFTEAGHDRPKYMLQAHGRSLFAHAVGGFSAYFATHPFLFIARDVAGTPHFVQEECARLGIAQARLVLLEAPTAGQAETVALGLVRAEVPDATPLTLFNIDTFRPGFRHPTAFAVEGPQAVDGYLEVFRGSGPNWSYVRPDPVQPGRVRATTEKVPVSDLCCTGLYHFRSAGLFLHAYRRFAAGEAAAMGLRELYVAPMYNLLLRGAADVRYHLIHPDTVIFCGVPAEYEAFLAADP